MFYQKSIVWKLALPLPVILIFCVIAAWFFIPRMVGDNARQAAERSAVQTVKQFKVIRGYYTKNVIAKAKANGALKPSYSHKDEINSIPLPATLIHDLSALLAKEDTSVALYSTYPFPLRKERKLDKFQNDAWAYLTKNPKGVFSHEERQGDKRILRVAMADTMAAQGCVNCHNNHAQTPKADWKLGDVRGVLEVATNISPQIAAAASLNTKIILAMAIVGLLLIALIIVGARAVAQPITRLTGTMKKLAEGDLTAETPEGTRPDEVGQMTEAVQIFKDNALRNKELESEREADLSKKFEEQKRSEDLTSSFTDGISDIVNAVSSASTELGATAQSMATISEQTNSQVTAVSSTAQDMSANVQTVASAAEEMSSSIDEIKGRVTNASTATKNAVEEVKKTGSEIDSLAHSADKIGEVIQIISDIAEQTNLLALNATIESARAGEAGKGFAVVANEVKDLANQTAQATEQIVEQINEIQSATKQAVVSMSSIGEVIGNVDAISSEIAGAMTEQGQATQEIAANIQRAATGSSDVSATITEIAESSRETDSAARQVTDAADELSERADQLKNEVMKFLSGLRENVSDSREADDPHDQKTERPEVEGVLDDAAHAA